VAEKAGDVDLADAIGALRDALVRAMWDGQHSRVRFRIKPVDLTVNVGVTQTGSGTAGVKWHILALGGERSRQTEATQTLRIQLVPVLFDENGVEMAPGEQLITDKASGEALTPGDYPSPDPA
jgi:hypothetical protein